MSRLLDNLLIFGRVLRRAGIPVQPARLAEIVEALRCIDLGVRDDVYHACRTLIVHRQDQIALFDLAFAAFWRQHHDRESGIHGRLTPSAEPRVSVVEIEDVLAPERGEDTAGSDDSPEDETQTPEHRLKTWSADH